jgi:folate-binding protein YgfZ
VSTPQRMSPGWYLLDRALIFRVTGRDARRYLHSRLSQDIRKLTRGESALAAALTAQGRVEGVFSVFCEDDQDFFLVCDGGESDLVIGALKRFVVSDRVVFEDLQSTVSVVHIGVAEASYLQDTLGQVALKALGDRVLKIERRRIANAGVDLIIIGGDRGLISERLCGVFGEPLTRSQYDSLRWRAGCAVFPDEINEQGMVLEFGLREAVSFAKGCYVGQEVVERSDAIGRVPRGLGRIVLDGSAPVGRGSSITSLSGHALGKVVGEIEAIEKGQICLFGLLGVGKVQEGAEVICENRKGVVVSF